MDYWQVSLRFFDCNVNFVKNMNGSMYTYRLLLFFFFSQHHWLDWYCLVFQLEWDICHIYLPHCCYLVTGKQSEQIHNLPCSANKKKHWTNKNNNKITVSVDRNSNGCVGGNGGVGVGGNGGVGVGGNGGGSLSIRLLGRKKKWTK